MTTIKNAEIKGIAGQLEKIKGEFDPMVEALQEMESRHSELFEQLGKESLLNLTSVKKNAALKLEYDQLTTAIQSLNAKIKEKKLSLLDSDDNGLSTAAAIVRGFSDYGQDLATEKYSELIGKLSPLWNEMAQIQKEALKENDEIHQFMVDEAAKFTSYLPYETQIRIRDTIEAWGYPVKNILESQQAMYNNSEFTRI